MSDEGTVYREEKLKGNVREISIRMDEVMGRE